MTEPINQEIITLKSTLSELLDISEDISGLISEFHPVSETIICDNFQKNRDNSNVNPIKFSNFSQLEAVEDISSDSVMYEKLDVISNGFNNFSKLEAAADISLIQ